VGIGISVTLLGLAQWCVPVVQATQDVGGNFAELKSLWPAWTTKQDSASKKVNKK
jgi:hypothetical protein